MEYIGIEYIYHKCGGLGDRLCGLINVLMLSKIFNKKFFIKWDETKNLNKYLNYQKYDYYNLNLKNKTSIKKNYIDKRDFQLIEILLNIKNKNNFIQYFNKHVLILYSNQDSNRFLLSNKNIDFNFETYKNMIFNFYKNIYTDYLIPEKSIYDKINNIIQNKKNIVGIQVRCGDCYMIKNHKHRIIPSLKDIYSILRNINKDIKDNQTIFITSDYFKVYEIAKEIFNDIIYYDKKPVHCDMNNSKDNLKSNAPVDSENIDKILIDHLILSNYCEKLYISGSNFGRTAALINKSNEIYHLFNKRKMNKLNLISKLKAYNELFKKYI